MRLFKFSVFFKKSRCSVRQGVSSVHVLPNVTTTREKKLPLISLERIRESTCGNTIYGRSQQQNFTRNIFQRKNRGTEWRQWHLCPVVSIYDIEQVNARCFKRHVNQRKIINGNVFKFWCILPEEFLFSLIQGMN